MAVGRSVGFRGLGSKGLSERPGQTCYFNTGCCSFDDGDCTGLEIAEGKTRLVRWPDDDGNPKKKTPIP